MNETENVEALISYLSGMLEDIILDYRKNWQRDRELNYPGYEGVRDDDVATQHECRELRRKEIARLNTILPKLEDSYINKLHQSWQSLVDKLHETARRDSAIFRQIILLVQMQLQITSYDNSSNSRFHKHSTTYNNFDHNSCTLFSSKDKDGATESLSKCCAQTSDVSVPSKEASDASCQYSDQGININRQYTEQQFLLLNGLLPKSKNEEWDCRIKKISQSPSQNDKPKKRHGRQKSDSEVLEKLKSVSKRQIRHHSSKFLHDANKKSKPVH